jgi:hypothetical protein
MKFCITVLLFGPVFLFAQLTDHNSVHREQSEYYKQFGNRDAIFFDSLNCYSGYYHNSRADTCTLNKVVFGFHPYWMGSSYLDYRWNLISDFCYFSCEADPATGNILTAHEWLTDPSVDSAEAHNVRTHLAVTLFSGHYTFFGSQQAQQQLILNLISLVSQRNADGINIDFEAVPSPLRDELTTFIGSLSEQFHAAFPQGILSMDLQAIDWGNVYDIVALKESVDLFFIMGYDYYWNGSGTAGPIAPLYSLTSTYDYSLCRTISAYQAGGMPMDRTILGLPYYARLWKTTSGTIPSSTIGTGTAYTYAYIMNNQVGGFVPENLNWEPNSFSSCFIYFQNSNWYQCFIPLARDLRERYDLVNYRGLAGMGIWALGYDQGREELWDAIRDKFTGCAEVMRSDTLYDCGGPTWNYYNDEDYNLHIEPEFEGGRFLEFRSFTTGSGSDSLWIYTGADSIYSLAGAYSGSEVPEDLSSDRGSFIIRFSSDGSFTASGWQAIWHDGTLGLADENLGDTKWLNSYPNPFHDQVTLYFQGSVEDEINVLCTDAIGREVPVAFSMQQGSKAGEASIKILFPDTGLYPAGGVIFISVYKDGRKLGAVKLIRAW